MCGVCPGMCGCAWMGVHRCLQVFTGVCWCARVFAGVHGCALLYVGALWCARVLVGVRRSVWVCSGVCRGMCGCM